jgi:hypothetical protein
MGNSGLWRTGAFPSFWHHCSIDGYLLCFIGLYWIYENSPHVTFRLSFQKYKYSVLLKQEGLSINLWLCSHALQGRQPVRSDNKFLIYWNLWFNRICCCSLLPKLIAPLSALTQKQKVAKPSCCQSSSSQDFLFKRSSRTRN